MENIQGYLSDLYTYIVAIVKILMENWYIAVLSGLGIILIAKYLENILIAAMTVVTAIFLVIPVMMQAFQSGNTALGIISIVILAILYFIMKYVYKIALFVVGVILGYIFTNAVLGFMEIPMNVPSEIQTKFGVLNWVALAVGVFIGFVTMKLTRQLTTVLGVFAGAYLTSMGILTVYTGDPEVWKKAFPNPYGLVNVSQNALIVFLASLVVLVAFGLYFNFRRKKKEGD